MAFRSASAAVAGSDSASLVVAVPSGAAAGDIAIVAMYMETSATVTAPSGFTQKADLKTDPSNRGRLQVFWKRLTGADTGSYTFTWTGSTWRGGGCVLFSGRVATGDPFDGTPGTAETGSAVTTLNVSASPAAAGGDAVGVWTSWAAPESFTPPTNYTEQIDGNSQLTIATRDNIAAGSTGNVTATCSASDPINAFLGVLAAAGGGGTDATATPAKTTTTIAVPQATISAGSSKSPAATAVVIAAPQATPTVTDTATPATAAAVAALPQASTSGSATVRPATIAAGAAVPQSAVSVATGPATLTATVTLPAASPQTAGNATAAPAPASAVIGVPAASRSGAATAFPATLAAVAALPVASPLAGGNVSTSPTPVSVVAGLPSAVPKAGVTVAPGVIVTVTAVPRAGIGTTVGPASIALLAALPSALPVTTSNVFRAPAAIVTVVAMPHASAFAEGAGVRGRLGELSARMPGGVVAPESFDSGGTIR